MLHFRTAIRPASILALSLLIAAPTQAAALQVGAGSGIEAAADETLSTEAKSDDPRPVVKPKSKAKGKGRATGHRNKGHKASPHHTTKPPAPAQTVAKPSLAARLASWVAAQLPLILAVCGCGLAIWACRDRRTLKRANAALVLQRQAAETKQQQLAKENQRLTNRANEVEAQFTGLRRNSENLEGRLYDADRKIAQLQTELKLALARDEFDQIDQRRKPAAIDASLEMDDAELPDHPVERQRLKDEAVSLQAHLAAVRRARQHATSAVQPKTVLNGEEDKTFWQVWAWTKAKGLRLNPQVSMGEFLDTPDSARWTGVHGAFNPRRVDMLISDKKWNPLIVIEHQGSGH
jgi:hypothetical protein